MQGGRVAPLFSLIRVDRGPKGPVVRAMGRELNIPSHGNHHAIHGPTPITTTCLTLDTAEFVRFRSRPAYS